MAYLKVFTIFAIQYFSAIKVKISTTLHQFLSTEKLNLGYEEHIPVQKNQSIKS